MRLRVAALASSARLYLLESAEGDGAVGVNPPRAFSRLALKWAAVASDFAAALVDGSRVTPRSPRVVSPVGRARVAARHERRRRGPGGRVGTLPGRRDASPLRAQRNGRRRGGRRRARARRLRRDSASGASGAARSVSRRAGVRASRVRARRGAAPRFARALFRGRCERAGRAAREAPQPEREAARRSRSERGERRSSARTSPTRAPAPPRGFAVARGAPLRRPRRARREVPRAHRELDVSTGNRHHGKRHHPASLGGLRVRFGGARAGRGRRFRRGGRGGRGGRRDGKVSRKVSRLSRRLVRGGGARAGLGFGGARRARRRRGGGDRRRRGLARRPGFACAARAAEIVAAVSACTDAGAAGGANALLARVPKKNKNRDASSPADRGQDAAGKQRLDRVCHG